MAETSGVHSSESSGSGTKTPARGSFFKKHKVPVLVGGGGLTLLLLSHKGHNAGSGGSGIDPATGQPYASEVAVPPGQYGAVASGGDPTSGSGGGDGSSGSGSGTDLTGLTDAINNLAAADATANQPQTPDTPPPPDQTSNEPATSKKKKSSNRSGRNEAKKSSRHANAHTHHSGGHGVTVHGRHFPGATSHHMGHTHRDNRGNIVQEVTVNYGGHSERHTSYNGGQHWDNHSSGPPSRRHVEQRHETHRRHR